MDSFLLTRSELQIMKVVWDEGAVTARHVHKILSPQKPIAYNTILTFMRILEEKGALCHVRSGRAFLYKAILTREQAIRNHVRDSIDRYFDGCPEKLLVDVLINEMTSPEQLGQVKTLFGVWQENEVA